ncbi:MAG: PDZ domain-containing protein [Myxococcota bacterium]
MNSRFSIYNFASIFTIIVLIISCTEKAKTISPFPEKFAGVGIEIEKDGRYGKVIKVIPNSPADEAGIKVNDILIAVDNYNISELNLAETVDRIRGVPNSTVILTIESSKDKSINVFSVKRKRSILTEKGYIFEE